MSVLRGGRVRRRVHAALTALVLASLLHSMAQGARVGARPLILLLQDGYGSIAAEVVRAEPIKTDGQHRYPYRFRVTFAAREVVAQPGQGEALPIQAGETLVVEITVGYACMIEDWGTGQPMGGGQDATREKGPLAAGRKYCLTVRYDRARKAYTHARGASILQPVDEFAAQRTKDIQATRAVAALAPGARLQRCLGLLLAPQSSPFVRREALAETRHRFHSADGAAAAERDAIRACYWKAWKGDTSHLGLVFLNTLDFTMRVTLRDAFARSEDRFDVWAARLCARLEGKTPAERDSECRGRANPIVHEIVDSGQAQPERAGLRLMQAVGDPAQSVEVQVLAAHCLLLLYRRVGGPPEAWEPFLHRHLPSLFDRCPAPPLWLLASYLESAVRPPKRHEKRAFRPGAHLAPALHRARERMDKLLAATAPPDPAVRNARARIGKLIAALR